MTAERRLLDADLVRARSCRAALPCEVQVLSVRHEPCRSVLLSLFEVDWQSGLPLIRH
jgi:hypothetical protein